MKKKIVSLFIFTLSVISCFLTAQNVKAETSNLEMDKTGYFWQREQFGEYHSWYLNNYTFNGRVAYCIQPGVTEGTSYSTGLWENTQYGNDIKERVLLIAYYGYDYPGHQTAKYRAATQALIWEAVGTSKVYYSTERWLQGTRYDVSTEENEIMNLVNNHYKKPSFNNISLTLHAGESYTLIDTNNVLSNYDVVLSNNVEYSVSGNSITIKPINTGNITINLKKKVYTSRQYLVYFGNDIQDMVSAGAVDPVYSNINIKSLGGNVDFTKKDFNNYNYLGEATLKGAVYGLYNSSNANLIAKLTTDNNGYVKYENLPYVGSYYLQEITASKGYQLDSTKYYFDSTIDNLNVTVNDVYEHIIEREIEITKVFASEETKIMGPESNVKFGFYDQNGNLIKTATTDKNGKLKVKLVYGTYTVKQLTTSHNTEKVENFTIVVREVGDTYYYTISNAEITSKLKVIKIDKDTGSIIERAGIKFKIKNTLTGEYVTQTITYPKAETISVFETDKNGVLITPYPLSSGKYVLEEVDQVIDGYLWNDKSVEFEIGENAELISDSEYGILFEVKFENQEVKGTIIINKKGEKVELTQEGYFYTNINLENVKLGLYASEDIYNANGSLIYHKDDLIKTVITDKDGMAKIDNLHLGKYYLQEIETVNNHVLDKSKYQFELKYEDQYTPNVDYSITIKNHLPKGTLEFTKTDFSTDKTLSNTLIEIYNDDDVLIYSGRTDEQGKIIINELPVGKYYILEKEAPEGYEINSEKMYFEIKSDGEIIKANMKDELIIEVPNTMKNDIPVMPLVIGGLSLIGIGLIFYEKRKRK